MQQQELIPHLFRTEFRKITAVLCKHFGIAHIEIAEDIASDTFLSAVETWTYKGLPANPTAWLYTVAKNKAKNYFHPVIFFQKNCRRYKVFPQQKSQKLIYQKKILQIVSYRLFAILSALHPGSTNRFGASHPLWFGINEMQMLFNQ
jgi:RNA polymerase sigma-70 factor (ECF subfamily)